jgi:hypothetical protein
LGAFFPGVQTILADVGEVFSGADVRDLTVGNDDFQVFTSFSGVL